MDKSAYVEAVEDLKQSLDALKHPPENEQSKPLKLDGYEGLVLLVTVILVMIGVFVGVHLWLIG